MKLQASAIENVKADLSRVDDLLQENGFVRAGQWDYERVTYDRKFEIKDETFYLRIFGYAIDGDVGAKHATIQLLAPLLGKHYYPHGVEYGEGENFPPNLIKTCEEILQRVAKGLDAIAN
ncbi:hypothetical protein EJF36_08510 [Bacillus sp. HMF5848]|uniref:YugN family protein n=1 Tax=Bacillus sp. HMF5848 TaxID=2495421 RepID=UPI000F7A0E12|nr:YugN family protein [Bacillus sp. HMF5848]RSK26907.1 hypothetical protein EJF36_08510 [Bacillus sp. HMF5848]